MTLYLSFADEHGWLGCVIAPGYKMTRNDVMAALRETHRRGVNPGGEVQAVLVEDEAALAGVDFWHLYGTKDEAEKAFGPMEKVNHE